MLEKLQLVKEKSMDFVHNSSANISLSKTQISKIIQSVGFLGRLLGPLRKAGLSLMKNAIKPLVKDPFTPLGLTAAASAANVAIHKNLLAQKEQHQSFQIKKVKISGKYLNFLKTFETIENEVKEQQVDFLICH